MPIRLRRTIYIGVGGTGVETVLQVRNYFRSLTKNGSLPPMIKCLFIDTNENEVRNIDDSVADSEILSLAERNAKSIYIASTRTEQKPYDSYTNMDSIRALVNGAGQYRSHGRFAIMSKENMGANNVRHSFSTKFRALYDEIRRIDAGMNNDDFETVGNDIEIHIAFSMSGGTGAGAFLSLAYLIRRIVPQCKIVAYAYSSSFFMNLPTSEQIQQNTYASLIELDYCMSSEFQDSIDLRYPGTDFIDRSPFDAVMYIDNSTYTREGDVKPFIYQGDEGKKQVEKNVAYAMAITAGDMGIAASSVFDNLINDITGGQYNVKFSDSGEIKRGWVSGLGISEIMCSPLGEQSLFSRNLALRLLKTLNNGGNRIESSSEEAFRWVKEFDLNESGDATDQDAVINAIISPDEFNNKHANEIVEGNIESGYQSYTERVEKPLSESILNRRSNALVKEKEQLLLQKVHDTVFGTPANFVNVEDSISIVNQFENYMGSYSAVLATEKERIESDLKTKENEWDNTKNELAKLPSRGHHRERDELVNELRSIAQERFKLRSSIRCRDKAIGVFEEIIAYSSKISKALQDFQIEILRAIDAEESKNTQFNVLPIVSDNRWGTINLTQKLKDLPTTDSSDVVIELGQFFKLTNCNTVLELSKCKDIDFLAELYAKSIYHGMTDDDLLQADSPIVRILHTLPEMERKGLLEQANAFSSPLMDIEKYGEEVNTTEHIYVAVPGGNECDAALRGWLTEILRRGQVEPTWIDINDPNRILIYKQIGVVPPYFIQGVSRGRNGITYAASCQEAFERKDDPRFYSPFTDKQFADLYHKWGYSLETNARDVSGDYLTWVKAIVLQLVVKGVDGLYKVISDSGEMDVNDPLWRKFKVLGNNRFEAFNQFASDIALCNEISSKIIELMKDNTNHQKWAAYQGNPAKYGNDFIDRTSQEWLIPAVQKQCKAELEVL